MGLGSRRTRCSAPPWCGSPRPPSGAEDCCGHTREPPRAARCPGSGSRAPSYLTALGPALWEKQENGTYLDVAEEAGLNLAEAFPVHWVCEFFDYDLDNSK